MTSNRNFVSIDYLFRGKENRITCFIDPINTLKLEIEEKSSNLEWTASFTTEYIEELTKKTGNFKSFDVFVAMLQTVLTQNSDSLSLDLMSYSDLEELRKLKLGAVGLGKSASAVSNHNSLQNKRYLILTYTTEFDKIHYPLPMTFQGVLDVKSLKETILDLRRQVYNQDQGGTDYEKYEISELNKKIIQLKIENDQLVSTVNKYKNICQNSESNDDLKKEIKAVKSIVRSLEEELAEERSKHQRILMRKNRENKTLFDEVAELKASKRNLNFRLHNLTNELAMYKRQRSKNGISSPRPPVCPFPKSSFDALVASSKMLSKASRTHSPHMFSDPETTRISHTSRRALSYSAMDRNKINSRRCLSADRYRTSSPVNSKFDPTAYVEQQKLKRKEIQEKKKRELRTRLNSGNISDHSLESSPVSYHHYKSNLLSSSNTSSVSNINEKFNNTKSKINSAVGNCKSDDFPIRKRLPTPLNNGSEGDTSESDSVYKYNNRLKSRKLPSGFKSDDSSITEQGDYAQGVNHKRKTNRHHLIDSGEEDYGGRISQRAPRSEFGNKENVKSSKSKTQQNNNNNNNNHSAHNNPSDDIDDIDRRLNALQIFFQKYLHNE